MATTYYLSNNDGDLTVGNSFDKYLSESTEPANSILDEERRDEGIDDNVWNPEEYPEGWNEI